MSLLLVGCKKKFPSDVIPQERMEQILYDYHLAQSMAECGDGDVEKNRYLYVQQVFRKHGVSEKEFDESMVWYSSHSTYLQEIYKHITSRYENEGRGMGIGVSESEINARLSADGDTANIWGGERMLLLLNRPDANLRTFVIKGDSTFRGDDNFRLTYDANFVTQNGTNEAFSLLYVTYTNDSVAFSSQRVAGNYGIQQNLYNMNEHQHDSVQIDHITMTFFVPLTSKESGNMHLLYITHPALIRMHTNKPRKSEQTTLQTDTLAADTLLTDSLDTLRPDSADVQPQTIRPENDPKFNIREERTYRKLDGPQQGNRRRNTRVQPVRR